MHQLPLMLCCRKITSLNIIKEHMFCHLNSIQMYLSILPQLLIFQVIYCRIFLANISTWIMKLASNKHIHASFVSTLWKTMLDLFWKNNLRSISALTSKFSFSSQSFISLNMLNIALVIIFISFITFSVNDCSFDFIQRYRAYMMPLLTPKMIPLFYEMEEKIKPIR